MSASNMTAGELVAALQMAREVEQARRRVPDEARTADKTGDGTAEATVADPAAGADENVTPLASARHTK
jgi:hypothetical protein